MKSGEFARLCDTTKNTLIHYDELGLLHPSSRGVNGYRDYSMADLARFSIIRAMTQAGFSLAEVREMLDAPDPKRLAELAEKNGAALKARIAEMRQSERLLKEIARQAVEAESASEAPQIVQQDARTLLIAGEMEGLKLSGNWESVLLKDASLIEELVALGVEASIAPYGVLAQHGADGEPTYSALFYVLPSMPHKKVHHPLEEMPAGRYACVAYAGSWEGVSRAYECLNDFIAQEHLEPHGPFYEISQSRLFDTDFEHYRCTLSVCVG